MTVIIFLIILAALIFVHELGHFLTAKFSGIRVDEFAIGFPPKLFGFTKGETKYTINLIPFGGFVKIFGENPDEESIDGPDKKRSFFNQPKTIQALVLSAGIIFNIIFAWLLISIGFMTGMPVPQGYDGNTNVQNAAVTVTAVNPGSPAEQAGLKPGDKLLQFQSGEEILAKPSVTDVQNFTSAHPDSPITVMYERGNDISTATVTPKTGIVADKAVIGISLDELGTIKLPFFRSFWDGAKLTVFAIKATVVSLAVFFYQAFTGHAHFGDVSGPVGIAKMVGEQSALGFVYLLSFTAIISINLAVINVIPFPALDGGRLLFVLIEKIKGSPINPKVANIINAVGFLILITLMVIVTYHDIVKLIIHR